MQIVLCLSHGLQNLPRQAWRSFQRDSPVPISTSGRDAPVEIAAAGDEQSVALRRRAQQTLHLRRARCGSIPIPSGPFLAMLSIHWFSSTR